MDGKLTICESDRERLLELLAAQQERCTERPDYLQSLRHELERARIVPDEQIDADVVTLYSRVRVRDTGSNRVAVYTLVLPDEVDLDRNRISVLAPIGTALLGYRNGDEVAWRVPAGVRRFAIEKVLAPPRRRRKIA